MSDSCWMNAARYLIIPKSLCTPCRSSGLGIFDIASTLSGAGRTSSCDTMCPRYFTSGILNCSLLGLNLIFFFFALSRNQ